ncbi:MarR family winged helix-turn-helix transcriptional regulator [Croceicoccus mobilis]|uniref:HTH marR-type domain-containing protein n=1 Tax=Croceicoccus mobilis TaxID=1703339 RepID=A0A916YR12_9SPHN|nr:MarR family winged helix-turn-helix transcriptional regulator [Croceicoccus mobilis]GGD57153.1 hypothetical protein GCM10010990_02970 [Croceicoccus mobilis]
MKDPVSAELRELAERLIKVAELQANIVIPAIASSNMHKETNLDDEYLASIAKDELKRRNNRRNHLPEFLFSEGGWQILLEMFICEQAGRPVTVKRACIASGCPPTTALRYIAILIENSLIYRTNTNSDRRTKHLILTEKGKRAMRSSLMEIL